MKRWWKFYKWRTLAIIVLIILFISFLIVGFVAEGKAFGIAMLIGLILAYIGFKAINEILDNL